MTYFGKKWLTGELYKEMAYEGQIYTPEIIDHIMNKLRDAKSEIESHDYEEAYGPQKNLSRDEIINLPRIFALRPSCYPIYDVQFR